MRVPLWLLSILMVPGLACDRQDDPEAQSVQCGADGLRALPGEDCPCEPGLRSLAGDCVPDDDEPDAPGEPDDTDECMAGDSNCGDSGAELIDDGDTDECRHDGSNCDSGEDTPPASCGYRTQTQSGWGSACSGGNLGCFRDAHFKASFLEGLYVGCGVLTANLTTSLAVELALPTSGKPRALLPAEASGYDGTGDPQVKTVLFGQVVALSLSVAFDQLADYDDLDQLLPLGDLQIADPGSPCAGMLVHEVLTQANYALGGCPSGLSAVAVNDCLAAINGSFLDGGDSCSPLFAPPPAL